MVQQYNSMIQRFPTALFLRPLSASYHTNSLMELIPQVFSVLLIASRPLHIDRGQTLAGLPDIEQVSPNVHYRGECVAKLFAALRSHNNRIRLDGTLNQCCAFAFVIESILLFFSRQNSFTTHSGVKRTCRVTSRHLEH
jgi:hypothetical protein